MRFFARTAAIAAVFFAARQAFAGGTVGRDGLPMLAGDLSIANSVVHGNAHMLTLGDSILFNIEPAYVRDWHPDRWSGVVLGQNFAHWTANVQNPSISSVTLRTTRDAETTGAGPAGLLPVVPNAQAEYVFNGTAAPSTDSSPQTLASRFYEIGMDSSYLGPAAAWANTNGGTVNITPLLFANPNGAATGTVAMSVRGNSLDTPLAVTPLNPNAATPTVTGPTVTVPAETWESGKSLAVDFRVAAGAAPAAGSNLVIGGVRFSNGGPGFQLACASAGGYWVDDFINDTATPVSTLQQYLNLTDSDVALVALGTNGMGIESKGEFKANLQTLIDRYRSAKPDMKFILMTTYDVVDPAAGANTVTQQQEYNQDMYELAMSNPGVMFLNQYDATPDWTTLNAGGYFADGRHPSDLGIDYFAGVQWNLMTQAAAASVPEPGTAGAAILLAGMAMRGRRRRRIVI